MVKIRLSRKGTKKRPFYFIVATDHRKPREADFIEKLGTYNPLEPTGKNVVINQDRIKYWMDNGAMPSDTVRRIINTA